MHLSVRPRGKRTHLCSVRPQFRGVHGYMLNGLIGTRSLMSYERIGSILRRGSKVRAGLVRAIKMGKSCMRSFIRKRQRKLRDTIN